MFFQLRDLRSKLGRKFFVLFFLVALVPMLLFASFSYNYVDSYLYRQSQKELRNEARFYSTIVYERLRILKIQIETLPQSEIESMPGIVDFKVVDWAILEQEIGPISESKIKKVDKRLRAGSPGILVSDGGAIYLLRRDPGSEGSVLMAQLDVRFLLGNPIKQNRNLNYCLFGNQQERLFCSGADLLDHSDLKQVLTKKGQRPNFFIKWEHDGTEYVAEVRTVFISKLLDAGGWKLWVSKQRGDVYGALAVLQRVFSVLVAVSLLLAVLVSLIQIRRILQPFRKLIEGTKAISERNFDVSVEVDTKDEFKELAEAFNQMVKQLGKQFRLLSGLSNIDQLILSVPDLDQVAQSTLSTLQDLVHSEAAAVAIRNPDKANEMLIFSVYTGVGIQPMLEQELTLQEDHWLAAVAPVHCVTRTDRQYLDWLWPGQQQLLGGSNYLFPIKVADKNRGVLALGWSEDYSLPSQDREVLKDFADRIAVAIAAVRREKMLYRQTHFDVLTQQPNRQLMKDRLEQALKHTMNSDRMGAVLFVDLDKFQHINDTEGYAVGDQILVRTAERLRVCVTPEDTVARQGGDEFIVVLNDIESPLRATRVAEKVLAMLSSPYKLDDKRYFMNCSIGISVFPSDGMEVETLLRCADTAMHRVKQEGGGNYRYFEEEMNRAAQRRVNAERRLRDAMDNSSVELHYQPQWTMETNSFSVEALVRINNQELGLLLPDDFIQVAEDTGLILDMGEWVIRQACKQMQQWRQQGLAIARVSVNVSGIQLARMDFVTLVQQALADFGLQCSDLELEITESILIHDGNDGVTKLSILNEMGVAIAIDDFGTGYSSLSYLHSLPFDLIKIDQSFVSGIGVIEGNEAIIRTIVDLAKSLGKRVMAEGVENQEQMDLLRKLKCDSVQGFLISRPLTADKVPQFIQRSTEIVDDLN